MKFTQLSALFSAPFSTMQHIAQHFWPADYFRDVGGGMGRSIRVTAGNYCCRTIGWHRGRARMSKMAVSSAMHGAAFYAVFGSFVTTL